MDVFNGPTPASVLLSLLFSSNNLEKRIVDFGVIWTRIVRVEGKHYDHLTTTTTQNFVKVKHGFESRLQYLLGRYAGHHEVWFGKKTTDNKLKQNQSIVA